ncbi:hypothetical protein PN36_06205 [Candidatus Thiomargarita nelsonii]|uniref:Uncharacterized protein n=1 Tax=Candidatus Thiomargarita nelsonii TaxID=1003181 RepID=A0A4E0RKD8_9GAMM|nr:hypothetical protein PN36_06205 [Candidatus Thiomargarita nelsonii]
MIDKTLAQWETLRHQLKQVSKNIYHKLEGAYLAYIISQALLKEANAALANAESTKSTIETELLLDRISGFRSPKFILDVQTKVWTPTKIYSKLYYFLTFSCHCGMQAPH